MTRGSAATLTAITLPGALTRTAAQEATPTQEQEDDMQITKTSIATMTGSREWFTAAVYVNTIAGPSEQTRLSAASVHFTPGSRTAWHSPPWPDHLRHRGRGPRAASRRAGLVHPCQ
jgi:hypothetical protein